MTEYVTIRSLTQHSENDIDQSFERLVEQLNNTGESALIQFRVLSEGKRAFKGLKLTKQGCRMSNQEYDKPNLEVIMSSDTWMKIASGSYSPLEAFIQGKMRIRGDEALGKRILQRLASSDGKIDICE